MHRSLLFNRIAFDWNLVHQHLRWIHHRQSPNFYEILGVPRNATSKQIKIAYYKKCKEHHPDKNTNDPKSHDKFVNLQKAYDVLSESTTRRNYDYSLATNVSYDGSSAQSARPSPGTTYYNNPYHPSQSEFEMFIRARRAQQQREWEADWSAQNTKNSGEFTSPLYAMILMIVLLGVFEITVVGIIYDHDMNQDNNVSYSHLNKHTLYELKRQVNTIRDDSSELERKLNEIRAKTPPADR